MDRSDVAENTAARPYGPLGLGLSLLLILSGGLALCALVAALGLLGAALVLGRPEALARFADLRVAATSDPALLQRIGIIVSLAIYLAVSICVLAAARWRGGPAWRDLLGWRPWSPLKAGLVFWITVPATIIYSIGADILVSRLYPPSQDWIKLPPGALWIGLFVALATLFAPITEELVFRGWLYTGLRGRIGRWPANLLTAALFALAHWEKTHLYALVVFPVGVALAYVRERSGSLKASMAFHALFNGAASILLALNV